MSQRQSKSQVTSKRNGETKSEPQVQKEEYFWVRWDAKREDHETDTVRIWVNGFGLRFNRNVPVIVPKSYLEAADNTLQEQFTQVPGERLKRRAPKKKYQYMILTDKGKNGEATEEEYLKLRAEGTEARRREILATSHAQEQTAY